MDRDRADQQQNRKLKAIATKQKLDIDDFVKATVTTLQGRQYLYWLLELCGIGRNPFTPNALNMSFACGQLNVGQQIQAHIIEVAPAAFLKMLEEKEEERLNAIRPADSGSSPDDGDAEFS